MGVSQIGAKKIVKNIDRIDAKEHFDLGSTEENKNKQPLKQPCQCKAKKVRHNIPDRVFAK